MWLPFRDFADDLERCAGAVGPGGIAGEFLIREIGIVLERAGRLDDVNALRPIALGEFAAPDRRVECAGKVDPGELLHLIVRGEARDEQIAHLQIGAGAVVERRRSVIRVGHSVWALRLAYRTNLDDAVADVIDADPVAIALRGFMTSRSKWSGTAADLLLLLTKLGGDYTKHKTWPTNARALSGQVRRAATFLRKTGLQISFDRVGHARTRMIYVEVAPRSSPTPSASSAPSAAGNGHADDWAERNGDTVRHGQPVSRAADEADGADGVRADPVVPSTAERAKNSDTTIVQHGGVLRISKRP